MCRAGGVQEDGRSIQKGDTMTTLARVLGTWLAVGIVIVLAAASVILSSHPESIRHLAIPRVEASRLMRYHGTIALEIQPDGTVSIWRDGQWLKVK